MRARERIALILVASVLVVAPFALGGAPRWAICLTTLVAAAAAGAFVTSRREMTSLSPLLAFVGLAAIITFLQLIPLPSALVAFLSPGKHQLVVDNARALGESPPGWIALSLDPPSTLRELAKLCGYLAFAYAALRCASNPSARQWLLMGVAVVGAAMAATALLHLAVDADKLFGVYEPKQALRVPTLAPLLNHNHLSALMALSAPIAVGLIIHSNGPRRFAWMGIAALCAGVGFLAESRGGAIALVLGLVVTGALLFSQRRGPRAAPPTSLPDKLAISVAALSSLALVGVLTAGGVLRDLTSTRLGEVSSTQGRFAAWRSTSELLQEFSWTGIGRGTFEMASTRVHDSHEVVYPHVENEYLQAAVDWGILGAAALALILVWLAITAARAARTGPLQAGAFGGIVALAVENFTDFSLWMPGIAYAVIATMAALIASHNAVPSTRNASALRVVRVVAITLVVAAAALAGSPLGRAARTETDAVAAMQGKGSTDEDVERARRVFARHPSDYAAAGLTAQSLFRARDRRAIAVVNRALYLHPTSGELHTLAGRMLLASQHREQATAAYSSALRYRPRAEVLDEILLVFPSDADAVRALPLVPPMVIEWTDRLRNKGRTQLALSYMTRYLSYFPEDPKIHLHLANVALGAGSDTLAVEAGRRAHALNPTTEATVALAMALIRTGAAEEASRLVQAQIGRPNLRPADRVQLTLMHADVLSSLSRSDAARHILKDILNLAEGRLLAAVHRKLADIEERLGNKHQASWERQRAAELDR